MANDQKYLLVIALSTPTLFVCDPVAFNICADIGGYLRRQRSTAFKAWLRGISQKVPEASKEGSFLGVGGVQVSDAEKATLADISKALGINM